MLPMVVMNHTSTGLQVLFFGALLSAIMSTTSGAILAPASILAENIIRPRLRDQSDRRLLQVLRGSVVLVGVASALMAAWQSNIYDLVAQSSSLSLVSLFVLAHGRIVLETGERTGRLTVHCFRYGSMVGGRVRC